MWISRKRAIFLCICYDVCVWAPYSSNSECVRGSQICEFPALLWKDALLPKHPYQGFNRSCLMLHFLRSRLMLIFDICLKRSDWYDIFLTERHLLSIGDRSFSLTFWEICLFAFLRVRWENCYHSQVCLFNIYASSRLAYFSIKIINRGKQLAKLCPKITKSAY